MEIPWHADVMVMWTVEIPLQADVMLMGSQLGGIRPAMTWR